MYQFDSQFQETWPTGSVKGRVPKGETCEALDGFCAVMSALMLDKPPLGFCNQELGVALSRCIGENTHLNRDTTLCLLDSP